MASDHHAWHLPDRLTNDVLFGETVPGLSLLCWRKCPGRVAAKPDPGWHRRGVGAVLGFVPQMLVLLHAGIFGSQRIYGAHRLHYGPRFPQMGTFRKSFIPLLVGSGCSVPGIMASRTIEEESDRRMTAFSPASSCGAEAAGHCPLKPGNCGRRPLGCARGLLPGNRGGDPFRSDPQEDPAFQRRTLTFRDGIAALPLARAENGPPFNMGARLELYQKSRYDHPAFQHRHLGFASLRS